jgi:hypothetical protein
MRAALLLIALAAASGPDAGSTAPRGDAGVQLARCPAATPVEAVERLEAAVRRGDEAEAVACQDFRWAARLLLETLKGSGESVTPQMIDETAELLETAFKREMQSGGLPEQLTERCQAREGPTLSRNLVLVFQRCVRSGSADVGQELRVGRSAQGWRVLLPMR